MHDIERNQASDSQDSDSVTRMAKSTQLAAAAGKPPFAPISASATPAWNSSTPTDHSFLLTSAPIARPVVQ